MAWSQRYGGREWQLTTYGVLSRNPETGEEEAHRTDGQPLTVTRYLYHWGEVIRKISREEEVPVDIILATLATENGTAKIVGGEPLVRPVRKEPGYVSDQETPHRISVGPCHVLISTARAAMGAPSIDREWLEVLENNMRAAFRFLAQQNEGWRHDYDPILASATYNAGGIYKASDPESRFHNRWHIRAYGDHLDRFADWHGDARAVLADGVEEPEEDADIPTEPVTLPEPELEPITWSAPPLLPIPVSARSPAEAITPEVLRDALRQEGFGDEDISRVARAMERITAVAEGAASWYHRARPILTKLLGAWRVLRG